MPSVTHLAPLVRKHVSNKSMSTILQDFFDTISITKNHSCDNDCVLYELNLDFNKIKEPDVGLLRNYCEKTGEKFNDDILNFEQTLFRDTVFKIGLCNHGILMIKLLDVDNVLYQQQAHLKLILSALEFKIKNIEALYDANQLTTIEDLNIKPRARGFTYFEEDSEKIKAKFLSDLKKQNKTEIEGIVEGFSIVPSFVGKLDFAKSFFKLEKIFTASFYKVMYADSKCTLLDLDKTAIGDHIYDLIQMCEVEKQCFIDSIKLKNEPAQNAVNIDESDPFEILHFIFMDIVGFGKTKHTTTWQLKMIRILSEIVNEWFVENQMEDNSYILNTTGDGMVIGFKKERRYPYELAIHIQRKFQLYNRDLTEDKQIHVRIGLHTGDVILTKNINNAVDFTGSGVILAQRIMDCGDAGHILASEHFAISLLGRADEYKGTMRKINQEYYSKHGENLIIYNVYKENEFGNQESPSPKNKPN